MHRLTTIALYAGLLVPVLTACAFALAPVAAAAQPRRVPVREDAEHEAVEAAEQSEQSEAVPAPTLNAGERPALADTSEPSEVVPVCRALDVARGDAELQDGLRALRRAAALEPNPDVVERHAPEVLALYSEALGHFDRACELLGSAALERRAIVLDRLGRHYEAYLHLEEFVRVTPPAHIDERTRERVDTNRARIERFLVGLRVSSSPPGAVVQIVGRTTGTLRTPTEVIYLPPREEPYEVRVALEGHEDVTRSVAAGAGVRPELEVLLPPIAPGPGRVDVDAHAAHPARSVDWLPPLAIAGGAGGVFLLSGVIAQVVADGRARLYNGACIPVGGSGCDAVRSEYDIAFGVAVASFVLAGLGVAAAGTFAVLELTRPRADERPGPRAECAFGLGVSASCRVDF